MKHILILLMGWLLLWCPLIQAQNAHSCRYWFDQDYSSRQQVVIGNEPLLIETSNLIDGLHTLYLQIGEDSSAYLSSYLFMKMSSQLSQSDSTPLWWHYSIDGTPYPPISVTYSRQLIHMDLDVSTIADGLHTLSYFIRTESGYTIDVNSSFFYKVPLGINGINRYDYCFNGDWNNAYQIDTMATDSLRIIKLINVDTFPIRSSNFFFDPNDGTPVIHARNEISFRFWDTEYRFAEKSSQYIDYNVTDTIFADTLERDTTKVIPSPTNNAIHWFKMAVGTGDSLSFLTDRRCSMQLYAPSGEMVYHSSGDSVLSWTGCHAWEDGVYYLAVHDAEGTGSISVSYQWIYRYAVLAWDVHRVGNGGISTITFEGNGFASLDTVYLIKSTDTIPTLYLDRRSNTTVGVIFNFEGADTGMYNAVFVYVDETMPVSNVVRVETVSPIVLTTNVSFPSTFLRGSTVTYKFEITNTGNMTAYNVPLYVYIGTPTHNSISGLHVNGLDIPHLSNYLDYSILNVSLDENNKNWMDDIDEDYIFYKTNIVDSNTNAATFVRYNYFFIDLSPYETHTISISVTALDTIEVLMFAPDSMFFLTIEHANQTNLTNYPTNNIKSIDNMACCIMESIECLTVITDFFVERISLLSADAAIVVATASIISGRLEGLGISGSLIRASELLSALQCYTSSGDYFVKIISNATCGNHENDGTAPYIIRAITNNQTANRKSLFVCLINTLGIVGNAYSVVNHWNEIYSILERDGTLESLLNTIMFGENPDLNSSHGDVWQCISNITPDYTTKRPHCQRKKGKGGESIPQMPVDPNEITGYIAESGSHYIGAEQIMLPYIIEFENDTAFATAHAHTVVVRDTLDGSVYDLNSFSAASFSIGDEITTINGGRNFTRTVDMRPTIDALAQVQLEYRVDTSYAVAKWTFTSLDPMTLLPAADSLGFLGIGKTGEVDFTINRKADLPDSTVIDNRAWIVFDNEEPIATSTWRNIIDNTPPVSSIDSIAYTGSTATVTISATDNLSGVWRYNVYALMDGDVLLPMAMNVPIDSSAVFTTPDEVVQFRSTAIDSAGNVEPLVLTPLITTVYDTLTITACDNYTWGDSLYTISGEYTQSKTATLRNAPDTVATLILTVNHSTTATESATACDSYTWHGTAYTTSTNTPTYSTTNVQGCDSTVTLSLIINNSSTNVESVTACDSYTWHGTAYTASTNTPTYSTTNAQGCDSTVTLHLTVNNSSTGIDEVNACNSYTWHGTTYTVSTNTPTYTSLNAAGCDSVTTLHLTINQSLSSIEDITACDSYTWHDSVYTASTLNSQFSTLNSQGCDSTITLHLTINYSTSAIETATACDSYTWHDSVYTASTSDAHFSTLNSVGCDSTVTLHLTINYSTHDTIVDSAVGSYTWHGNTYTESGEYLFESLTEDGCDSVIVLQLTINEVGISTIDSLGHITLYPNPTTGWVTIVHDGVSSVEVFDQSGCCIATFHGTSLFNIKDLPTGVYTLRITYQGGSAVKRIIKH